MKILIINDDLLEYLKHIVTVHASAGITPEEGMALYHAHRALVEARTVDEGQVAKVATGELGGVPMATVAVEDENTQ